MTTMLIRAGGGGGGAAPGVKSGDRRGLEKESGAVKGKAGTGNVKCEGDRDGRAEEPAKALSNGVDEAVPSPSPPAPLEEFLAG